MKMILTLFSSIALLCVQASIASDTAADSKAERPNFILFLADDKPDVQASD